MDKVILDGKKLISETIATDYIFSRFEFPEYYGNDLESLYDAFADINEDMTIVIINRNVMESTAYGSKLSWVLEDAANDNGRLTLVWMDEDYADDD